MTMTATTTADADVAAKRAAAWNDDVSNNKIKLSQHVSTYVLLISLGSSHLHATRYSDAVDKKSTLVSFS